MQEFPWTLLCLALKSYVVGSLISIVCLRRDALANVVGFGAATLAGLAGTVAAIVFLVNGRGETLEGEIFPSPLPFLEFSIRCDPLGAFFVLIVSVLGIALSLYSLGYARGFYDRKSVGLLAAFYNLLLLTTTLVFLAGNAFFFLVAWEMMALSAYCLVSFEHEKTETRKAGVLYFILSHIGTGCLILGFLLLFEAAGHFTFAGFHGIGDSMPEGKRNAAFVLFLIGFGVKAGIVPLHIWLPAAHPVAPSNVSALMSGVLIK